MWKARYTKSLTVAMSPEMYAKIQKITDEDQTSKADLVRSILGEHLDKWEQDPLRPDFDENEV